MNASRLRITFAIIVMSFMLMAGVWLALRPFKIVAPAQARSSVIYVDRDAPGPAHNGLAWATAYADVQPALAVATSGDEIWVAEGVYYPGAAGEPYATFQLKRGVALYGGFAATETQRTQRDWVVHVTVLSGDIDRNDLADANGIVVNTANISGTNAYHVVTGSGVTRTAVLDGFAITAGKASGSDAPDFSGGGMYNTSGSNPALTNVTFSGNRGNWGGGMYNISGSNPTLTNVTFGGNRASDGGGMYNDSSSPALVNVTFSNNRIHYYGGGMYNTSGSNPTLTNVMFSDNTGDFIDGSGGGMYNDSSNPTLTNVTFSGNSAHDGGGMYNFRSSPTLTNVMFSGNSAQHELAYTLYGYGGGMYNDGSNLTLTNVTFNGNGAFLGGGMYNSNSSLTLMNVTFSSNAVSTSMADHYGCCACGGGMYNSSSSPTLMNVTFSGNQASGGGLGHGYCGGGMANSGSSPTLMNVTFSGNWAMDHGGGMDNGGGNLTLVNSILWGDSPDEIYNAGSVAAITYSDVYTPTGVHPGTGNINADPLFVAPTTENYRLLAGSPAIDAGNTLSVTAATDLDGFPRVSGTAVDMGAYEYTLRIYVPIVFKN